MTSLNARAQAYCGDSNPKQVGCSGLYQALSDSAGALCFDAFQVHSVDSPDYCGTYGGSGGPGDEDDLGGSPIVLNLAGTRGFRFTSADNGVMFDIDGDRAPERIAWTESATQQAFLFLDRNANGIVDDGTELFGNVTPQEPSPHPNGFPALLLFDGPALGGNGDHRISAEDLVFEELRLWVDGNHDGVSQAAEMVSLQSVGVLAIDLDYSVVNRSDRFGNLLRYMSLVAVESGGQRPIYDVFLRVQAD